MLSQSLLRKGAYVNFPANTRTIMSPYPGSRTYITLKKAWAAYWWKWNRIPRFVNRTLDLQRVAYYGVPEDNLDPVKNQWKYFIDSGSWGGVRDKAAEDVLKWLMYPIIAWVLAYAHGRCIVNDKYNVFAKWRPKEE
jgi:hypothetical protein